MNPSRATDVRRRWHWPLAVTATYLAFRALDCVFILLTAGAPPDGAAVDTWTRFQQVATNWDGQWYQRIAEHGYPSSALGPDGQPVQTTLAFFPLFPLLTRGLMAVTHLGFPVIAPTLSLVLGGVAMVLVHRLLSTAVDPVEAFLGVALICACPAAAVFQIAYTESLALLLVASILLLVRTHRYLWATAPVLLLGLTRNIVLVTSAVVMLHWVTEARQARRRGLPSPPAGPLTLLLVSTVVATLEWPVLTAIITGEPSAYTTTMRAWPGYTGSVLRSPWLVAVSSTGPASWALAAICVTAFLGVLMLRRTRAWGPELWAWAACYPTYVFLTTGFSSSIVRYLLLAFPLSLVLVPAALTTGDRRTRVVVVSLLCVAGVVSQYLWIANFLVFHGPGTNWGYP